MAALYSTSCRSHSYSLLPPSSPSSSSSIHGQNHQRLNFSSYIAKRVLPAKVSFHSRRNYHLNVVLMQDGAVATPATSVGNETFFKKLKGGLLSSVPSTQEFKEAASFDVNKDESTVSITVVGASGDLAKKKIFPALFALYYEGCLPKHFTIFGYARSKMTDAELRNMVSKTLTCRIDKRENCGEKMDQFLKRCFYHSGQYDSLENFAELDKKLKEHEGGRVSNRLFYLSIPPNIFVDAVKCTSSSASSSIGWTRVIVEKPFGRDSDSSAALTKALKQYLEEDQIFRIDHYLGKELVENLSVLRFSNLIFEPLWSRRYIRNVQLIFSEDFGTEGRGGYFDNYGIIRDIMQNHLLQILALFAMETPVSLDAEDIRNEKVKVLRSMRPLQLEDVVVGQYNSHTKGGVTYPAYIDDSTVPKGSLTPTFAAAALFIDNARWDGVPFLMKAGKALHKKRAEIRVQFRHVPGNLYNQDFGNDLDLATNELVIRVQPDEAIDLKINNKVPGLGMRLDRSNLNLLYAARYSKEIPDAYERLLLDAIEGERRLFIRSDELDAAWTLFTPVLKELEEKNVIPEYYPYGSRGPVGAHYLAARYNVRWGDLHPPSSSSSPLVFHHNQLVILQQSKTTLTVYHSSFCFFVEHSLKTWKTTENQDSVGMSPRKIHFCTFLFVLFSFKDPPFVLASSRNVSLEFPSFNLRNLTLLGDSYLRNGVIGLTRDVTVPSSSSGTVIYSNPISFFDQESNTTASFSTRFSFSIRSANENSFGDGMSFFLSQDNQTLGSPGGYLGLVNSSQLTKNKFVAVEFDTRLDARFNDPNDHHIGLDIDSLNSVKTADPILQDIDLKSGDLITAWIDYKNDLRVLKVYMSYSSLKPINSLLTVHIDLSEYLKGDMYVGFSGSTEGSTELHLVTNWSFRISGFLPLNPNSDPYNVSDSSVTVTTPVIPISNAANKRHRSLGFGLGITGPAIFCTFLVAFGYISFRKWQKIERVKSLKAELMTGPKEFSYKELKLATRGFHSSRIIGRGAFGNVYKAFFKSSGTFAAVKRSKHSHEGKTEFLAELSIIACLRHKNLIPLQGWCVEKGEVLLVYEFMPYGSLDRLLYEEGSERGIFLNWAHRQKTAVGLASSLTYLHHECEQKVIHRDIKTSNIMLDANFNARLGDFGLARIMEHDKSPVSTLTAGTMGYLAPEYLHCGIATEKTDVFSYGVVILELACGKRPIEKEPVSQKMVNLVDWVWGLYGEGKIIEAADSRLNGEFEEEEMRKLLLVGLSCANPDDTGRPAIRRVLQILNGEAEPFAVPRKKPSLTFSCDLAFTLENIVSDCD